MSEGISGDLSFVRKKKVKFKSRTTLRDSITGNTFRDPRNLLEACPGWAALFVVYIAVEARGHLRGIRDARKKHRDKAIERARIVC